VGELIKLTERLERTLPSAAPKDLEKLKQLDSSLREAAFALEQEEQSFEFPAVESPRLGRFAYLFEGWKRNYLSSEPVMGFAKQYAAEVGQTARELENLSERPGKREAETEKKAIEQALEGVRTLAALLAEFVEGRESSAKALQPTVDRLLKQGEDLKTAFDTLEKCSPITEPCPFCGGQISLSGRCRSCTRRLPHLEEAGVEGEQPLQSDFITRNCRAVDLALLQWEQKKDQKSWREFQEAVRQFSAQVSQGKSSLELLSASPDRPVDDASELRQKEEKLRLVSQAFQDAVILLGKYSGSSEPPGEPLPTDWRDPLRQAETILKDLQTSLEPEVTEPNQTP
jgi:hypothetical protein